MLEPVQAYTCQLEEGSVRQQITDPRVKELRAIASEAKGMAEDRMPPPKVSCVHWAHVTILEK